MRLNASLERPASLLVMVVLHMQVDYGREMPEMLSELLLAAH